MIKTQTPEENKFLRKILPHYYQYVSMNPDTMLTRFYGMHRVKMRHLKRKVHFVIMHSVFDTKEKIYRIYDLKGSTVGRSSGPSKVRKEGVVYKDLDLVDDKVRRKRTELNTCTLVPPCMSDILLQHGHHCVR